MIVTVTANTAMDHILFIKEWQFDQTLRAHNTIFSIGGKPTDASWILAEMGIASLALGFKAGITGEAIEQMLNHKGVATDFITADGESRRNIVIVIEDQQQQTTITSSTLLISQAHIEELEARYNYAIQTATCIVLGGTLPTGMTPSFYTRFIRLAREHNIPVVFDASGPFLKEGLKGRPTYIKPNRDELMDLTGYPITCIDDAYRAGQHVKETYGVCPIISLGADGGLAITDENAYRIHPIPVKVASTAGAGDGILAGLTASIWRRQPIEEGLKLGFAASTAIVTKPGTAQCDAADIQYYKNQIRIEVFQPSE